MPYMGNKIGYIVWELNILALQEGPLGPLSDTECLLSPGHTLCTCLYIIMSE
jgi:hypothetical protein